jgi:futalosine hydrolase
VRVKKQINKIKFIVKTKTMASAVTGGRPAGVGYAVRVVPLLICTATPLEAILLRERAGAWPDARLLCTGVGPVNAAHAVTLAVARQRPDAIVVCGVGGAYPGSGLGIGDVVCADLECYGDLGADSPAGFLDMKALGFPVIAGPEPVYNDLPLQIYPVERRVTFVTVSTCTGTDAAARAIAARTGGAVENMEGAAVAHVARLHDIPVGEVRGISNLVTERDTSTWRLREAALAAQEALVVWLSRR